MCIFTNGFVNVKFYVGFALNGRIRIEGDVDAISYAVAVDYRKGWGCLNELSFNIFNHNLSLIYIFIFCKFRNICFTYVYV